uniref:ANK_REP_REGION domain-containing protein n=1 Tax=Glossina brevipalpis TaxID=37001 RepID=A0A1A9X1B1_9MUSC
MKEKDNIGPSNVNTVKYIPKLQSNRLSHSDSCYQCNNRNNYKRRTKNHNKGDNGDDDDLCVILRKANNSACSTLTSRSSNSPFYDIIVHQRHQQYLCTTTTTYPPDYGSYSYNSFHSLKINGNSDYLQLNKIESSSLLQLRNHDKRANLKAGYDNISASRWSVHRAQNVASVASVTPAPTTATNSSSPLSSISSLNAKNDALQTNNLKYKRTNSYANNEEACATDTQNLTIYRHPASVRVKGGNTPHRTKMSKKQLKLAQAQLDKLTQCTRHLHALFSAVEHGHLDKARTILESTDINVNSINTDGLSPLDVAVLNNNRSMTKMLLQHGALEGSQCK